MPYRAFGRQPPGHLGGLSDNSEDNNSPLFLRLFPAPTFPQPRESSDGDVEKDGKKVGECMLNGDVPSES